MRLIPNIRFGTERYPEKVARRLRALNVVTWIGATASCMYAVAQILDPHPGMWRPAAINIVMTFVFAAIPLLHRLGPLVAPIAFVALGYVYLYVLISLFGTGTGMQTYYLVAIPLIVVFLGTERVRFAAALGLGAIVLTIAIELTVPYNTGLLPPATQFGSFIGSMIFSYLSLLAIVFYALRQAARAEAAAEREYNRSEALLGNILPTTIADRLKNRTEGVIADRYDAASILFADMAGFTTRASDADPADLVQFLNRVFTDFDRLVESHGLEKIKTTGDAYVVVSGVPVARPDHAQALARLALDMRDAAARLRDVPIRIGIASGPVVAGVVGTRKFFYDVWGDAVNVAARMETSGVPGKIHVAPETYELLKAEFTFEDRGLTDIKGKGPMRTWFLIDARAPVHERSESWREAIAGGPVEAIAPLAVAARTPSPLV